MAITTIWAVRHNGTQYPPGKVLTNLPKEEEARLVEKGLAIYDDSDDHSDEDETNNDSGTPRRTTRSSKK